MWCEASQFSGSRSVQTKQNKTNKLPSFIDRCWSVGKRSDGEWVRKMSEVVKAWKWSKVVVFGIVQGQPCKRIMQNQFVQGLSQKWSFWHWKDNKEFTQEICCFNIKLSLNLLLKGRNWRKPKPFGFLQLEFSSLWKESRIADQMLGRVPTFDLSEPLSSFQSEGHFYQVGFTEYKPIYIICLQIVSTWT
jgi:hypothetical protein